MSSGQKLLKVLAITLAVIIIVSIVSFILGGFTLFCSVFFSSSFDDERYSEEIETEIITEQDINKIQDLSNNAKLDIDLEISNLEIKVGNKFNVEKRNIQTNLKCKVSGNTLKIEEKYDNWFHHKQETSSTIIITVPEGSTLSKVEVSMGVGRMEIADIHTSELDIEAGMGVAKIDNVIAEKAEIDGGAGNFTITNSTLTNLDFDCGVGATTISGDIKGNSKISCGVGKTELHLNGAKENYRIRMETGIGEMTLNNEKCSNSVYGSGDDYIKIEGGVGKVEVTTK